MSLPVVNTDTAFGILSGRRSEGSECLVNVCGKVTCVSEVVRIKDNHLFMVKFIPNVDVIIKRKEFLHWQLELAPYKEYILTDLRPTTLQKGSSTRQRVFTVTRNSKLVPPDRVDTRFMTESEILKQYGLQDGLEEIPNVHRHDSIIDGLFSYQGKVTAVLDQGLGVFELDSTVRLFVGPVPAVHKFSMLKPGTTLLVQNAHYTTSKQYPRVTLYCCMLTKVQCVDEIVPQAVPVKLSQTLQKLLYLTGQSQTQLDHMFKLRLVLKKQFLDTLGERYTERIFNKVIGNADFTQGNLECAGKRSQRVLLDEFLNVPHSCPLLRADKVKIKFTTIEEIKENISDVSSDSMEWKSSRQLVNNQQVVLGILNVSEKTGQTVLRDNTGSVGVVTCCYHGDRDKVGTCSHVCTGSCDCDKIEIGEKFPCPYVHTCCIGRIVAVCVYERVCETMVTRNVENFKGQNGSERSRLSCCDKYLLFDMRNVVYIGNNGEIDTSGTKHKSINNVQGIRSDRMDIAHCSSYVQGNSDMGIGTNLDTAKTTLDYGSLKMDMAKCNLSSNVSMRTVKESKICNADNVECVSNQKPSALHKHIKPDGCIVFCRKAECCDKQTVVGSKYEVASKAKSDDNKVTLTSDHKTCKENCSDSCKNEPGDSNSLQYKLGKTAFKVKPVSNRKRQFCERNSNIQNDSGLHKVPKSDCVQQQEINQNQAKDDDTGELENKPDSLQNLEHTGNCDSSNDVIIYIENKGSMMCGDGIHRFNVECTVLKKQGNEKLILEFSSKSVKWYPLLCVDTFYKLSVPMEAQSVLSVRLSNSKLQKMLQKNKSRRCIGVNENVCVTRLWNMSAESCKMMLSSVMSIQDVLKSELPDKFVSFEGWIINRTLVKPGFASKSLSKEIGSGSMYSRLHVQDSSGSEDIWVYLNDSNIVSDKGLIPGSRVRFYGLERKLSQLNNIYCRLVPLSSVQILCVEAERGFGKQVLDQKYEDSNKQIPVLSLVDLWVPSNTGQVFQCVCDIEKILKVSLKCLCETCGSLVIHAACSNTACNGGGVYRFLARASAIIDDSTSVAMVTLTGSSVQSMLQLSHDQWKCLEEEVSQTGEVFVQQFNPAPTTSLERFVYMLCDNHAVKQTWLMTCRTRSSLDINKIGHDEFCMKTFDTGSSRISTQCLPFLQLECVAMTIFEPSVWAIHHLSMKE